MAAETQPLLKGIQSAIPKAPWATAIASKRDAARLLPQNIAHRGYKAAWPENTMGAFKGAVQAGAHAIETDLRLSADGVVVLSHDSSLKRCFGIDKNVHDSTWEYLSTVKTLREPQQHMPRLLDLLQWLAAEPSLDKTWLLLDIKTDDKAEDLIKAIAKAIAEAPASVPWEKRIILGCWNASFFEAARRNLPEYPVALIAWSLAYARHFLPVPNVGFNMLQKSLIGPLGAWFLRDVKRAGRPVFAWTVNDEKWMEWCIRKNYRKATRSAAAHSIVVIDGVITDDPKLFGEVCARWEDEVDGKAAPKKLSPLSRFRSALATIRDFFMVQTFGTFFHFQMLYINRRWDFLKNREQYGKDKQ